MKCISCLLCDLCSELCVAWCVYTVVCELVRVGCCCVACFVLLGVVCWLLCLVCFLPCVVCCLMYGVCSVLYFVRCVFRVASCLLAVVSHLLFALGRVLCLICHCRVRVSCVLGVGCY